MYLLCLTGVAGGLSRLANMPACNVLVVGSQKRTLSGFSQVATLPHTGFVYYSDIVQETNLVSFKYCKFKPRVNQISNTVLMMLSQLVGIPYYSYCKIFIL
jgi:hypothetical protein